MMTASDLFLLGYTDLVSVIPPDAPLTETLSKRIDVTKNDPRGKIPGKLYSGGWGGLLGWQSTPTTPADIAQMEQDGANIGLKAARFPAIDVDVKDPSLAALISEAVETTIPTGPIRIGQPPKRLYLFRLPEGEKPFTKLQIVIPNFNGERHLVEVLGAGQQYLIEGIHAKTKLPYVYDKDLVSADALPELSREMAESVLAHIASVLDDFGIEYTRSGDGHFTDREAKEQEPLKAKNLADLKAAVEKIKNTADRFATRQDYLRMGYGLRGATQDDPALGLELFQHWAGQKDWGEPNDPKKVAADWHSFHAPYELGAEYVYQVAREFGHGHVGDEFELEEPPMPEVEVEPNERKTRERLRRELKKADAQLSDMWLMDKVAEKHADDILYCPQRSKMLYYDHGIWREDTHGVTQGLTREIILVEANKQLAHGASDKERKDAEATAKALSSSRQLTSLLNLAKGDARLIVQQDQFDVDPDLLGTPDGIIDLRTGARLKPDPKMYISKSTTVVPGAPSALWQRFLDDATDGDVRFQEYLQRVSGYCLTAHTYESVLFFLWGEGKRGKSTFVDTISAVLGSYAKVAAMSTFTAKKTDRHTTELAALAGSRLVTAQETQENEYWDEARVKSLTGGDSVTARFLFQDDFTFTPGFKLLFSGNNRPKIQNADAALRRRVQLIPFNHLPKNPDPQFKNNLRANELGGVLSWMIEGVSMWRRDGLKMPQVVIDATNEYFSAEDPFGRWTLACCESGGQATSADLYASWVDWCDKHSESAMTQKRFVSSATNRGFRRGPDVDGKMTFLGVSLKQEGMVQKGNEFKLDTLEVVQ
jgi:putative DNA primase/helicase